MHKTFEHTGKELNKMAQYRHMGAENFGNEFDYLDGLRTKEGMSSEEYNRTMVRRWSLVLLGSVLAFIAVLPFYF